MNAQDASAKAISVSFTCPTSSCIIFKSTHSGKVTFHTAYFNASNQPKSQAFKIVFNSTFSQAFILSNNEDNTV